MIETLRASIDSAGRLVIPKTIREAAGLRPDTPLRIRYQDGRVEIEPETAEVRIEMRRGVAVAIPPTPVATVTTAEVEAIRQQIREESEERNL